MKLKTKFEDEDFSLGEICEAAITTGRDGYIKVEAPCNEGGWHSFYYKSLEEVSDDWEDYEEPNGYYGYDTTGNEVTWYPNPNQEDIEKDKEIGNYFETEEEAEKAVRKLKAWKRLEDKGVEFYGWRKNHTGTYDFLARWKGVPPKMCEIINDLDICFGGEE